MADCPLDFKWRIDPDFDSGNAEDYSSNASTNRAADGNLKKCGRCKKSIPCVFRCEGGSHYICRLCVNEPKLSAQCFQPEKKQSPALVQEASEAAPFLGYQATVARSGALMVVAPIVSNGQSWDDVKGDFSLIFTGHGYDKDSALQYNVKWNGRGTITVTFHAGQIFTPQNEGRTQNLILAYKVELTLSSGASKRGSTHAYCGNSNFGCSEGGLAMVPTKFKLNECHTWGQGMVSVV